MREAREPQKAGFGKGGETDIVTSSQFLSYKARPGISLPNIGIAERDPSVRGEDRMTSNWMILAETVQVLRDLGFSPQSPD